MKLVPLDDWGEASFQEKANIRTEPVLEDGKNTWKVIPDLSKTAKMIQFELEFIIALASRNKGMKDWLKPTEMRIQPPGTRRMETDLAFPLSSPHPLHKLFV